MLWWGLSHSEGQNNERSLVKSPNITSSKNVKSYQIKPLKVTAMRGKNIDNVNSLKGV